MTSFQINCLPGAQSTQRPSRKLKWQKTIQYKSLLNAYLSYVCLKTNCRFRLHISKKYIYKHVYLGSRGKGAMSRYFPSSKPAFSFTAFQKYWNLYTFLGNCPPTPPLSQHCTFFSPGTKCWFKGWGGGEWAVSQKRIVIQILGSFVM